jgi:hypothetical protein
MEVKWPIHFKKFQNAWYRAAPNSCLFTHPVAALGQDVGARRGRVDDNLPPDLETDITE